jgi:hypothetical protein
LGLFCARTVQHFNPSPIPTLACTISTSTLAAVLRLGFQDKGLALATSWTPLQNQYIKIIKTLF